MISFLSDNADGVSLEILKDLEKINQIDHSLPYGEDETTKSAKEIINKKFFEGNAKIFFVYNGTSANVLGLKAFLKPYDSVLSLKSAHLNTTENGAFERICGSKIILLDSKNGKLTTDNIKKNIELHSIHNTRSRIISITQASENGLVYSNEEIKKLANFAHKNQMLLHLDGARLANAIAYLMGEKLDEKKALEEFKKNIIESEVDVLSFGITKNGAMFGDAIVILNRSPIHLEAAEDLKYFKKQQLQVYSKSRYLSSQFKTIFESDLWIKNAYVANKMAKIIYEELKNKLEFKYKVCTNAIFFKAEKYIIDKLEKKYLFHHLKDENGNDEIRLVTSFATSEKTIEEFIKYTLAI